MRTTSTWADHRDGRRRPRLSCRPRSFRGRSVRRPCRPVGRRRLAKVPPTTARRMRPTAKGSGSASVSSCPSTKPALGAHCGLASRRASSEIRRAEPRLPRVAAVSLGHGGDDPAMHEAANLSRYWIGLRARVGWARRGVYTSGHPSPAPCRELLYALRGGADQSGEGARGCRKGRAPGKDRDRIPAADPTGCGRGGNRKLTGTHTRPTPTRNSPCRSNLDRLPILSLSAAVR